MAEYGLHELEDKDLPKTVVRFSITETVLAGCVNVHLYDCGQHRQLRFAERTIWMLLKRLC